MTKQYDLTQGGILNKLLLVALPIMGTQFMQMTYNLTDMFWLGRLSSDAVAASGTVGMYLWLSMALMMFGRMGAEIGVSQNIGRGDTELARGYAQSAFSLAALLGIGYMLVMQLARGPLIGFFNIQEEAVVADAKAYLVFVSTGVPLTFITAVLSGCFSGTGNTRISFYINAVGLVANMVLDPMLIFVFDMGIIGAAVATVVAQAIVCGLLMFVIKFSKHRPFEKFYFFKRPDTGHLRQIFLWGAPVAIESLLFTFLSMVISRIVASWGAGAIAVQRVGSQVESLSWLICGGFSSAVTAFIGQNFGAGKWTRIHKGFQLSLAAMLVWGVVITVFMFFCAEPLIGIFLHDPAHIAAGGEYLRILAACQLASCVEYTTAGCFRGMGKTLPPSVVSVACNALRVPAAYFLSLTPLGLTGVWWAVSLGGMGRGIWLFFWYRKEKKKMPLSDEHMSLAK